MDHVVWNQLAPLEPGLTGRWEALCAGTPGLGRLDRIRQTHGPELARFVSLQAELGRRARGRLDVDALPFLTTKGAEQATPRAVATYRAARFARCRADALVWDACAGIGSDLIALAERFDRLVATDSDAGTLRCAVANVAHGSDEPGDRSSGGRSPRLIAAVADAARPPLRLGAGSERGAILGLFDPDRRPRGRREARPEHWGPPLGQILAVAGELTGACFKLSPSLPLDALHRVGLPEGTETTWISLDGEMKELSLWTGVLAGERHADGLHRAVALRTSGAEASYAGVPTGLATEIGTEAAVRAGWLVELDVSVQMADLSGLFAEEFGLQALEGAGPGGYFAGGAPVQHPMARSYRILDRAPADRKRVRSMLRTHDVGRLVVKTRNYPEPAERLATAYRGTGSREGLLVVTRVNGKGTAFLVDRVPVQGPRNDPGGR